MSGRIRFYSLQSAVLLGLGALTWLASGHLRLPAIGLAAGVALLLCSGRSFRRWSRWSAGQRGELAVVVALKTLPQGYVLLNDLVLPDGRGNIDHVVVGPNGVFAVETKNYSKHIRCEKDFWFLAHKPIRSLSRQAKRAAIAVRSSIAGLFPGQTSLIPYVTPVLVFVDPHAALTLIQPTVPVVRLAELPDFIRDYAPRRPITRQEQLAIVRHLRSLQRIPPDQVPTPARRLVRPGVPRRRFFS
ncbi:MAG TPA: nuclease-related domain-containing protein [candidate division Zixibacteria bacterium]|nr:nuclease-related domain-containing protein [candidate division Zixibacteria bacterium]